MTSLKDRQRAAARARLEREMAQRLQLSHERRKRAWIAGGAALAVVVVVVAVFVIVNAVGGSDKATTTTAATPSSATTTCTWTPNPDPSASPAPPKNPDIKNTGTPPTADIPDVGARDMTLNTNQGQIVISLDLVHAPCAAASFNYLAGKKYFDNTICHRLVTDGIYVLQCGDPTATGRGGPSYTFGHENLPIGQRPMYAKGVVAMANPGNEDANGSQFFIIYKDIPMVSDPNSGQESSVLPAQYTVIGTVTSGMDVVQKVADGGVAGKAGATDGKPKLEIKIKTLTVGPVKS